MKHRSRVRALAIAWTLVFSGASSTVLAHDPITTKVTWSHDVWRLVQTRCIRCHSAGGRGPMSLATYDEARPWARAIREAVLARHMPNWHAMRGYGDFANDPSLSPFEVALIVAWVDGGAPKGPDDDKGQGTGGKGQGTRDKGQGTPETGKPGVTGMKPIGPEQRQVELQCADQPLAGRLLAVTPQLEKGGSAGIAALLPNGRREIVAWIRDYDPDFPTTYWLRTPLLLPSGSRLKVEASGVCSLPVTLGR